MSALVENRRNPLAGHRTGRAAGAALLLFLVAGTTVAQGVEAYGYVTDDQPYGSELARLFTGHSVTGTFYYDQTVPASGTVANPPTAGSTGYAGAVTALSGTVAGLGFSDGVGRVLVGDDKYTGEVEPADILVVAGDPGRQNPLPPETFDFIGFEIDGYTLQNARLFWIEGRTVPFDFLVDQTLPTELPDFDGRLALDFVVTGTTEPLNTVFFDFLRLTGPSAPGSLTTPVRDANGNGSADFAVSVWTEGGFTLQCRDGADGTLISAVDLGVRDLRLLGALGDVSGNSLDEVLVLTIADDGTRIVELYDSGSGELVRRLKFGQWPEDPIALLALDDADGGLGARAVAVVQTNDQGRPLAIVRDALTGTRIGTVSYGKQIGTPIGAAVITDIDDNGVEEIAVFFETAEGRAKAQIRDALTGDKLATIGFDERFTPLLVGRIPPIDDDGSDELVVVGVNEVGGVRIEVKDSLTRRRLTTVWLRRIEEETPTAIGYVDHPEGPALAVLTEGADGKYRTRVRRLTSSEPGWLVYFPPHITPHDFEVMDDTSGNFVPELLVVGENQEGLVKAILRDAETGEELFRTRLP